MQKIALITGTGGGIGKALSKLLLKLVTNGRVLSLGLGLGAGPCNMALWNDLSMMCSGYLHSKSHSFSSSNRVFTVESLEQETAILFARL